MPDTSKSTVVTLRMVYLARLREAFGNAGETFALDCPAPRVASLLDALRARGGPFAAELATGRAVRVAVNHSLASTDAPLRDGDEVALFPPVTGG